MKKLYLIALSFLTPLLFFGQTIQGTIKPGSLSNSAIVAIKPSADMVGAKISTFYFAIAIPTAIGTAPTVAILTNFNANISYALDAPVTETVNAIQYYVYNFRGDGAQTLGTEKDYTSSADNNMVEFTITTAGVLNLAAVGIVSLPDGGSTSNSFFNIFNAGTDVTNQAAMFYGVGSVNSASGYSGTSYKFIAVVLPVKFLSFYALKSGDNARLSWTVASDNENKYFDIERSTNGRGYTAFARVNALSNGQAINTYESTDPALSKLGSKDLYYRIKQVDKSGGAVYSVIRNLNLNQNSLGISLYPNPARSISKLIVDAPAPSKAILIIRDATGKQLQVMNLQFVKGINQKDINVSSLPAGDYNVSVVSENLNQTIKLSKLN